MITNDVVEKVAKLGRLELTTEEIASHAEQLNKILDSIQVLQQVNTDGIAPLAHVLPIENVLRADEVGESLPREQVLANAPEEMDGMFKVPKIV